MTRSRRRPVTPLELRRKAPSKDIFARYLIVCEGENTERLYFSALVDGLGLIGVDVTICHECGSAPISVVEYAEKRARREGKSGQGGYDGIFCVFDRDEHESFQRAIARIEHLKKDASFPTSDIRAVTSVPCIEFWFLLHIRYSRAPYSRSGNKTGALKVLEELRATPQFSGYQKTVSREQLGFLIDKRVDAVRHAKLALADAKNTGEPNPSTYVHVVLEELASSQTKRRKMLSDVRP